MKNEGNWGIKIFSVWEMSSLILITLVIQKDFLSGGFFFLIFFSKDDITIFFKFSQCISFAIKLYNFLNHLGIYFMECKKILFFVFEVEKLSSYVKVYPFIIQLTYFAIRILQNIDYASTISDVEEDQTIKQQFFSSCLQMMVLTSIVLSGG